MEKIKLALNDMKNGETIARVIPNKFDILLFTAYRVMKRLGGGESVEERTRLVGQQNTARRILRDWGSWFTGGNQKVLIT